MDSSTPNVKDQLVAAIEAYAAARASNNQILLRFASETLSSFLNDLEIKLVEKQENVSMSLPG